MVNGAAYAPVLLYFYPNCSLSYKASKTKQHYIPNKVHLDDTNKLIYFNCILFYPTSISISIILLKTYKCKFKYTTKLRCVSL